MEFMVGDHHIYRVFQSEMLSLLICSPLLAKLRNPSYPYFLYPQIITTQANT